MTLGNPRALNMLDRVTQSVDGTYNDREVAAASAEWQQPTLDGTMPFVARHEVKANDRITDIAGLLPEDVFITRTIITGGKTPDHTEILATNDRVRILLQVNKTMQVNLAVAGATQEEARGALLSVLGRIPTDAPVDENVIDTWIWYMGRQGPQNNLSKLTVPSWEEIEQNYTTAVHGHLSALMKRRKPSAVGGKIILWHGPAGTGKTTALRALAREWKDWCSFHYVSDPERLFHEPSYLMTAATTRTIDPFDFDEDDDRHKWKLVVAEDSGEFLHVDAKEKAGSALSRLLNFSDGILGQGSNTLILLTTNEPLAKLHPAITRPGRCMSQIEFERFDAEQASRWMGKRMGESYSLAELIEKRDGHINGEQIMSGLKNDQKIGFYV